MSCRMNIPAASKIRCLVSTPRCKNGIYQDWNYWNKIIKYSDIYYIEKPLLIYYKSNKKKYIK